MTKPPGIQKRTSAGGVIFRPGESKNRGQSPGVEVALVQVRGGGVWCLPKGIIDEGEDPPAAALREVREETGLTGKLINHIDRISYWYFFKDQKCKVHKTVHFYLMKCTGGSTSDHDHEVDEARWFPIDDAVQQLTYKSEKDIVKKARGMIESFPVT